MSYADTQSRSDAYQRSDADAMPPDLARMTDLGLEFAEGEIDIRGYDLYTRDGEKVGTIEDMVASPSAERA